VLEANNLDLPIAKYYRDPINYFDLPKLYNSARVCVDAFNELTKPYGQINSRVYEALACGLPVVTSKPIKED
jgi:glycosyltransferase involved in cell wall biosynthesis